MPDPIRSRPISTRHPKFCWPWDEQPCPLCKGKGTTLNLKSINLKVYPPIIELADPARVVCMVCEGSGICPPSDDEKEDRP